jgi:hypothetical protein
MFLITFPKQVFSLSTKDYYHQSKFTQRKKWSEEKLRSLGLLEFVRTLPTSKTHCSGATIAYLEYLQRNKGPMDAVFGHELGNAARHKRWKSQIHKPKTLDRFCLKLLDDQKDKTIISYGDASFCHNSRGHQSSLRGNWLFHRLQKIHGARVRYTKEYNTSQVCTRCYQPQKLVGLGTKRDPEGRRGGGAATLTVGSKHFVRKCVFCLTIW